ncbi:osmotically-inducible protein OsmY [Psychrobacter sp. PL15]|nr:osmotically-inducible protein OsmY [Psychrobacter sp. PL15]
MTRMHLFNATFKWPLRTTIGIMLMTSIVLTGCTTNYLTNSTTGTYGVPMTERTIPQRLLDRSIEHTVKINIYSLQENLQQNSRMSIDSFNSEVLLSGEVPTEALKVQIEKVVRSMPDVRQVYNELEVSVARGYSSTIQDGYITSKLLAKVIANNNVKAAQIRAVTHNGVVYIMGRMTPTQQSHVIDIATGTVGITELVLLTTVVNDSGAPISDEDIMFEQSLASAAASPAFATPIVRNTNSASAAGNSAPAAAGTEDDELEGSSSPYIDLYQNQ